MLKLKLTVNFKNGQKIKMIKNIGEPPKGTDKDTHYLLESHEMADSIVNNGLNVFIPPTQIERVFVQPKKGEEKNAQASCGSDKGRQALQGTRL